MSGCDAPPCEAVGAAPDRRHSVKICLALFGSNYVVADPEGEKNNPLESRFERIGYVDNRHIGSGSAHVTVTVNERKEPVFIWRNRPADDWSSPSVNDGLTGLFTCLITGLFAPDRKIKSFCTFTRENVMQYAVYHLTD